MKGRHAMASEFKLEPALETKLKRLRLRPELPDRDTLALKRVPANRLAFNKASTNLLIKRSAEGMPCVVCVDEDLDYFGEDPALAQAFAAGPTQQGWRILTFGGSLHGDLSAALDFALEVLGAEHVSSRDHETKTPSRKSLLDAWSQKITSAPANACSAATLFRNEEIEQVAACTLTFQGRLPLILGNPGTGKTNLLHGVASQLAARNDEVLSVNMGSLVAGTLFESEREALLATLLREARDAGVVLALEQAEWAIVGVTRGLVLLREALDQGARLIATALPDHERRFASNPLAPRLELIRLSELCASDTCRILEEMSPALSAYHGVEIDAEVEHATVERSISMEGSLPGKAIQLLDLAAARASLTGNAKMTLMDVYVTASRMSSERV
jgi:ATP-dependent Clp protease ATP-binding subunit ClpA